MKPVDQGAQIWQILNFLMPWVWHLTNESFLISPLLSSVSLWVGVRWFESYLATNSGTRKTDFLMAHIITNLYHSSHQPCTPLEIIWTSSSGMDFFWHYSAKLITPFSIIKPSDAFEKTCIWRYGKWSICSFGANAPFSIISFSFDI